MSIDRSALAAHLDAVGKSFSAQALYDDQLEALAGGMTAKELNGLSIATLGMGGAINSIVHGPSKSKKKWLMGGCGNVDDPDVQQ